MTLPKACQTLRHSKAWIFQLASNDVLGKPYLDDLQYHANQVRAHVDNECELCRALYQAVANLYKSSQSQTDVVQRPIVHMRRGEGAIALQQFVDPHPLGQGVEKLPMVLNWHRKKRVDDTRELQLQIDGSSSPSTAAACDRQVQNVVIYGIEDQRALLEELTTLYLVYDDRNYLYSRRIIARASVSPKMARGVMLAQESH